MKLSDGVEILQATVTRDQYGEPIRTWNPPEVVALLPAEVMNSSVAKLTAPGVDSNVEELRAVIPPFDYDPDNHRIRWRGKQYTNDGPPKVRRRNGRDHHLTITLKLVS